jgi:hypothetical protein
MASRVACFLQLFTLRQFTLRPWTLGYDDAAMVRAPS